MRPPRGVDQRDSGTLAAGCRARRGNRRRSARYVRTAEGQRPYRRPHATYRQSCRTGIRYTGWPDMLERATTCCAMPCASIQKGCRWSCAPSTTAVTGDQRSRPWPRRGRRAPAPAQRAFLPAPARPRPGMAWDWPSPDAPPSYGGQLQLANHPDGGFVARARAAAAGRPGEQNSDDPASH